MKDRLFASLMLALLSVLNPALSTAFAQGTAFTYQGRLNNGTNPANGNYDLRFALYDAASAGTQQGNLLTATATAVSNGLFTATLDFGNQFPGANRWLEVGVRTNGGEAFTNLSPRQPITASPYAITAGSAGSVSAANILGIITAAQLPVSVVTNGASGVNITGTFSGNGGGLANVPVGALVTVTNLGIVGWGYNNSGQTTVPGGLSNVTTVAAGGFHSLALKSDATVVVWGDNGSGQTNLPAGLSNVTAVAAGGYYSLALRSDGRVFAWGNNSSGQTNIPAGLTNVTAVAAGSGHSLARRSDGTVVAWGDNSFGQTNIPPGLSNVTAVAAGLFHSLALKSDGRVVVWGDNGVGQTNIPAGLSNVTAVAAGSGHSLALKSDGTVIAWGNYVYGQTTIPAGLSNVTAVAAGFEHSLALKSDGTVVAWGDNTVGQTNIPPGLSNVIALAPGCVANHVMVIQRQIISPLSALLIANNNTLPGNIQVSGSLTAASFSGNGANVTNVNAATLNGLTSAGFWKTNGNAGANPTNGTFIGTTDNLPLEFKVNGTRALRLEYAFDSVYGEAPNVIGGASGNFVASGVAGATIGGGFDNQIQSSAVASTIGGGYFNQIQTNAHYSTIGGGYINEIQNSAGSTIGGGESNQIQTNTFSSTIGGGFANRIHANAAGATIGGGQNNHIQTDAVAATIGGGVNNIASGVASVIPGGENNLAAGSDSFAAGYSAYANNPGTFVWADNTSVTPFSSTSSNQFLIRATGGVGIGTTNPLAQLMVNGNTRIEAQAGAYSEGLVLNCPLDMSGYGGLQIHNAARGGALNAGTVKWSIFYNYSPETGISGGGLAFIQNNANTRLYLGTNGNVGIGTTSPTNKLHVVGGATFTSGLAGGSQSVIWTPGTGSWSFTSDRNAKEHISPVDARAVLEKLARVPVLEWSYIGYDQRHLGPMAQDFHAAFPLNDSTTSLNDADLHGVALAAIQGLNQKVEEKEAEIKELRQSVAELKRLVQTIVEKQ